MLPCSDEDMEKETTSPLDVMLSNDLAIMGLNDIAYVKTVFVDGQRIQSVHAADGTPLTMLPARDIAFAAVRQHEMEPVSVH